MSDKPSGYAGDDVVNDAKGTNTPQTPTAGGKPSTSLNDSDLPAVAKISYGEEREVSEPRFAEGVAAEKLVPEAVEPVAVLVCHGMGQQVRYETLGDLAKSLMRNSEVAGSSTTVRMTRESGNPDKDDLLSRAEIQWRDQQGGQHEVHLYEAYWAPLTEGRVTYRDTLKFLFVDAAWPGFKRSSFFRSCRFQRWMFGKPRELKIGAGTRISLVVMVLFLAAQVAIVAAVLARLAEQLKLIESSHVAWMQAVLILLPGLGRWWTAQGMWQHWIAVLEPIGWWLLVAEVLLVRYFLIQYVGDVAAYISPYKDSKFEQLRHQIQKVGLDAAKVIYGFTQNPAGAVPYYKRVVMVGHSLGSVVAYDTLNAAINLDNTCAKDDCRDVAGRTHALITFGSPLDKTAFLFRNQPNTLNDPLREQMAAASQPLIVDYEKFRSRLRWTNLWSPADVISGSLEYYDNSGPGPDYRELPGDEAYESLHVVNVRDPQARILFRAHVQYWKSDLLARTLYREITR
ncbi:MAG: hypothetical protein ABI383_07645 [Acidobacteriaceae bacterium]